MTLRVRNTLQRRAATRVSRNFYSLAETLELRLLLSADDPTSIEQLMLYDTNRVRVDPQGELSYLFTSTNPLTSPDSNVNDAISFFNVDTATFNSQWSALVSAAPVAWNSNLATAAAGHNAAMIAADQQSHQVPGEPALATRITNAGYNNWGSAGENVYAFAYSEFYAHSGFLVDWGNATPGHRNNMMSASWKEVGISITPENNPSTSVGPLVVTQEFGYRTDDTNPRLLGVVYNDLDHDNRYDDGEGLANVNISITGPNGTFSTTTKTAGGWQVQVPAGTYKVAVSGGTYTGPTELTVTVSTSNKEVDFLSGVRGGYVNFARVTPPTEGIGVARSSGFYLDSNTNRVWNGNGSGDSYFRFGNTSDIPLVGDWNGDGYDEIGVFRNGEWYLDKNADNAWSGASDQYYNFGIAGDIPVVGDWNGNGIDKIGVVRNGVWYLDTNGNGLWNGPGGGDTIAYFGNSSDTPIIGDWNGDRIDDIGVVRAAGWYLDTSGNRAWDGTGGGDTFFYFGNASDTPVIGDWNNDGKDEIGILRNGSWYLDQNGSRAWDSGDAIVNFGATGDIPLAGRWKPTGSSFAPSALVITPADSGTTTSSTSNNNLTANQLAPAKAPLALVISNQEVAPPNVNDHRTASSSGAMSDLDLSLLDSCFSDLLQTAL